ncbi:SPOR domain-containing protein [Polaribacter sp. MSW13]|uniref:SPOR domain-containing protein n=1 Tax=Polaribacter marinus TaxID=2916838 RepID=A0A9X2ALE3_9FLAO|nr:SPOR domain-containing protein [Polaribacter marinus]MCI2227729.1 SPOR domain-containing protein [Polaribacter marinus]
MKKYLLLFVLIIASCGKKEIKKETVKQENPIVKDTVVKSVTEIEEVPKLFFTVQIAALKSTNATFNNIKDIQIYKEENLTKYRLGMFSTYKEARTYRTSLLDIYPDAFVQALKSNKPIHIKEALK